MASKDLPDFQMDATYTYFKVYYVQILAYTLFNHNETCLQPNHCALNKQKAMLALT